MTKHNFLKKATSIALATAMVLTTLTPSAIRAGESTDDGYVYISMNVPYNDFYKNYNLTDSACWEVEEGVDAVSTATTSKFKATTGLANGTYNNDKYIMGVTIPVAVKNEDLQKLQTSTNNAYKYVVLEQKPEYYSTLTIKENGQYDFSKMQETTISKNFLSISGLTLTGRYGDYQIDLDGFRMKEPKGIKVGEDEYIPFTIYGAILKTEDQKSFGMTCLENLWFGTKAPNVEIAWSVKNGQGMKRGHGSGGEFYQFDMNGAKLSGVDVITNYGVVSVPCDIALPKYYEGNTESLNVSMKNNSKELLISGVPADLENVKVSVSGGLASDALIANGKVELNSEPTDGVSYTVTISSSNYAGIRRTISTPITESQIEELNQWILKGENALEAEENTSLKNSVQKAKDAVSSSGTTSVDAVAVMKELKAAVKKTFEALDVQATLVGNKMSIAMNKELKELKNPKYALTVQEGRKVTTLSSGVLNATTYVLETTPVVGTTYKLTIESDNFQDALVNVIATEGVAEPETTEQKETTTENIETTKKQEAVTKKTEKKPVVGKASIKKAAKKRKANKLSLTLNKVSGINGYEIRVYTTNKKAKKNKGALVVKKVKKANCKVVSAKLKGKKKIFVRVRAYKNYKGSKIYGDWSKIKKVTSL
ncbi:MAG: hypothetical protein K6G85_01445 [Eubacterium sp.]|nr:hypothetical protein [Eubacterium sp.]